MTEKFRNKYRSPSARLAGYDYTRKGAYFVTICTNKHICYFGDIFKGKMILSETGVTVQNFWKEIQDHFPTAHIDEFIIMPNHIHGIIIIKSDSVETPNLGVSTTLKSGNPYWKSNSIGLIINQFKRICTIKTKSLGLDLSWQPRYYDHIIRSANEFDCIRIYIKNNPDNWLNDDIYPNSINM